MKERIQELLQSMGPQHAELVEILHHFDVRLSALEPKMESDPPPVDSDLRE